MLADAAQVSEGKLHILGGGWSVTGPPDAVGDRAARRSARGTRPTAASSGGLELVDSDGYPVMTPDGDGGENPIMMGGEFEVGRPPGTPHGAPIGLPLALNLAPLPLASREPLRVALHDRRREPRRLAPGLQHPLTPPSGRQRGGHAAPSSQDLRAPPPSPATVPASPYAVANVRHVPVCRPAGRPYARCDA